MIWEKAGNDRKTAVLYIDHVHNPAVVKNITAALDEIISDGNIRCVVIASNHEKNWCIGLDIPWIMEQYKTDNRAALKDFFVEGTRSIFLRLLTAPFVTIAAITGHAFGNGVIMALHCDIRLMRSDRGYFCLPEAEMDLTDAFTPSSLKLMDVHFDPFIREVMIPTAKKVGAAELLDKKIIDLACESREAVMKSALERAAEISSSDELYNKIIDGRKKFSLPVIEIIKRDDEAAFDYIIEKFWKLMLKMGVV